MVHMHSNLRDVRDVCCSAMHAHIVSRKMLKDNTRILCRRWMYTVQAAAELSCCLSITYQEACLEALQCC